MNAAFPNDFLWGVATAAYQVEGAAASDGRGPSIWDTFSHAPGRTTNSDTGDVACDHYNRYRDDVALMKSIGVRGYRFSISWPRVMPNGKGKLNPKGVAFYDRLIDELLTAGIKPLATLYHWDLPQPLEDKGGWPDRRTADCFADYAAAMFGKFGDRVEMWFTHNEPMCTAFLGYKEGMFAPGRNCLKDALAASHTLLLSHGRAVQAFRASGAKGKIGIVLNLSDVQPATKSTADFAACDREDAFANRWYLDPVFGKGYPRILVDWYGREMCDVRDGDLEIISAPIDVFGLNYYTGSAVSANPAAGFIKVSGRQLQERGTVLTDMGWGVWPEGLYRLLMRLKNDYGNPPIVVTENGMANKDAPGEEGRVDDGARVEYLKKHFAAAARAIKDGADLRGYMVWSLMDNFEWAQGYSKRFGVVYVDYPTQRRTMKKSAGWYSRVIASNGAEM